MAKTKLPKAKQGETDPDLLDLVVTEAKGHLEVCGRRRDELTDGGFDPELASAAGALLRVLLAAATEQRAQRQATQRELDAYPVDQILAHLKQRLSADECIEAGRDLAGTREEESLL